MASYSWGSGNGGSWNTGSLWTPNGIPGVGDAASITISASYAVTIDQNAAIGSLVFNAAQAEIDIGGNFLGTIATPATLTLTGTFSALGGGTVIDGTLKGGTVEDAGGTFGFVYGTLDGVTWDGGLTMFAEYNEADIVNGLVLRGAGGVGAGTLSMTGSVDTTYFIGNQTLDNAAVLISGSGDTLEGDTLTLGAGLTVSNSAGANTIFAADGVANNGSISATGGTLTMNAAVANAGQIGAAGGGVIDVLGALSGAGGVGIGANGTVILHDATGGAVTFSGTGGVLGIASLGGFTDSIANLAAGDRIDLLGTVANAASLDGATLDISNGGSLLGSILTSGAGAGSFVVASDGEGGTLLTYEVACFASGTRISSVRGAVPVEELTVGDMLETDDGALRPVVWIGHRTVDCTTHPRPAHVWPVRVRAGAFGHNRPVRDLLLSPDHAVYIKDVLVPVRELIDGDAIAQLPVDRVSYWHVELETHDVIMAEDLPVESFLDSGNRDNFANGGDVVRLHPEFAARSWDAACAPVVLYGPQLLAIRAELRERRGRSRVA